MRANLVSLCLVLSALIFCFFPHANTAFAGDDDDSVPVSDGPTVAKDERWPIMSSEFGEISAVKIHNGENGCYYLHFITMNPNSFFLPAYLYSEMIFYVNSGSGTLSWIDIVEDDDKLQEVNLQKGDIYRLQPETLFYIQNNFDSDIPRQLQIYAIFSDSDDQLHKPPFAGAYVGIHDLVLGFDDEILQEALNVPPPVIEELRSGGQQPQIVQGQLPKINSSTWDIGSRVIRSFLKAKNYDTSYVNDDKKAYNIFRAKYDVENCYGWSKTVTKKQSDQLKDTDIGVFMVNLTKGAMMGPHWNQNYAEISIVLHGCGMILEVCPTIPNETLCKTQRFKVEEGDVFVVPKYHPVAQMSYNNGSFVFVGFTILPKKNNPRCLAGKSSILRIFDKLVLGKSFNASEMVIDRVSSAQKENFIFECISCAEEEERLIDEEDIGREREGKGRGGSGRRKKEREGGPSRKEEEEMGRQGEEGRGRERQEKGREGGKSRREEEEMGREGEGGRGREREGERQEEGREKETSRREEEEEMGRKGEEGEGWGRQEKEMEGGGRGRQEEERGGGIGRKEEEMGRQEKEGQGERDRKREEEMGEGRGRSRETRKDREKEQMRGEGGGWGRQGAVMEGEMARKEEEKMERRLREAEEAVTRGRGSREV